MDRLTAAGIPLIGQYGVGGHRIDFAATHPDDPTKLVLAIEADGRTYHSSPTARDRDRLRQEHLERLGWKFHRIWSTDWFHNRDAEVARLWRRTRMLSRSAAVSCCCAPAAQATLARRQAAACTEGQRP